MPPFTPSKILQLTEQAIGDVTADRWRSAIEHTRKIISEAWEKEGVEEQQMEDFVISLGREDSSDSSSSDEDVPLPTNNEDDLGIAPLQW